MVEPRTAPSLSPKAPLPDLHSTVALAELVGLSPDKLTFWAWRFPRHQSYRYFEIARRGGGKGLIATDVFPLKGKGNIARAKTAFARAVEHEPESFEGLDFGGFRATFERITTALVSLDLAEHLLEGDM